MKLFVGLGNPGQKYARHRHNVGFMAVERMASRHGFTPWRSKFSGHGCDGDIGGEEVIGSGSIEVRKVRKAIGGCRGDAEVQPNPNQRVGVQPNIPVVAIVQSRVPGLPGKRPKPRSRGDDTLRRCELIPDKETPIPVATAGESIPQKQSLVGIVVGQAIGIARK